MSGGITSSVCFRTLLQAATQEHTSIPFADLSQQQAEWAVETGLGPLLCWRAQPEAQASPHWPLLHSADLTARMFAAEQTDAMTALLDACVGQVQTVTLIKGISVCDQYYPLPHLRPMRDIDILVDRADLPIVEKFLDQLGYQRESDCEPGFYATHHHSMPFVHPDTGVWMEVHHGLMTTRGNARHNAQGRQGAQGPQDPIFDTLDRAAELRPACFQGRTITRLSDELQVVYLAAHWAYEFRSVGGIIALFDMIFLLQEAGQRLDWEKILSWLPGSMAATPLYLLLSYLSQAEVIQLAPEILPELFACQRAFGARNLSVLHTIIDRYFVGGQTFGHLASLRNIDIVWKTLLLPGSPIRNFLLCPVMLLLPWQLRTPLLAGNM
jgi:hypothetical protein